MCIKTQIDQVKTFIPPLFKIIWQHFHKRNMFISKIPKFSTPLPFIVKEIFQIKNHAKRIASLTLSRRIASLTLSFTLPKKFSSISGGPTLPCSFNKQVRYKYFSNSLGKAVWVFNPTTLCEATILLSLPLLQWVWPK